MSATSLCEIFFFQIIGMMWNVDDIESFIRKKKINSNLVFVNSNLVFVVSTSWPFAVSTSWSFAVSTSWPFVSTTLSESKLKTDQDIRKKWLKRRDSSSRKDWKILKVHCNALIDSNVDSLQLIHHNKKENIKRFLFKKSPFFPKYILSE